MRPDTADLLRCARCHQERTLVLTIERCDDREVREGGLTCSHCGQQFEISDGIVDLLYEPPEFVRREAAGLERFAEFMRNEGWDRERILALPNEDHGYWVTQERGMRSVLTTIELEPGRRLLDVGANCCWASNMFAERGLEVIALDISKTELQGLRTADYFIERGVYFERVLSTMFDVALASESLDYAFCCEVLHHNDITNLGRTMRELYRALRPGGSLIVINEPLRFPFRLKRDHADHIAHFDGYEHVFFFHEYFLAARRAGFHVRVRAPSTTGLYEPWMERPGARVREAMRTRLTSIIKRYRPARQVMLAYKTLLVGDTNLSLVATKPK